MSAEASHELDVKTKLRQWIAERNGKIAIDSILDDTPILELRIVSSLQAMELILFVERLRKRPVDMREIHTGVFRNIDSIYKTFFAEA